MKKEVKSNLAPQPIGIYSQAIKAFPFIFLSGQIAINPATGLLQNASFEEEVEQIMQNILNILKEENLGFNNVVKTSIFLTDLSNFETLNTIYKKYIDKPFPARETVEVSKLPMNASVEISVVAYYETYTNKNI